MPVPQLPLQNQAKTQGNLKNLIRPGRGTRIESDPGDPDVSIL